MTGDERATDDIDQLMDDGLAALEDEHYELAAEIFRRVVQVAPFRHDARDYLALALDQQFSDSGSRGPQLKKNSAIGTSSAAAASTSRSRPIGLRVPMWLVAGACAVALFAFVALVVFPKLNLGGWIEGMTKKTTPTENSGLPAAIAGEVKKAESALERGAFDEAIGVLRAIRESDEAADLELGKKRIIDRKIGDAYAKKGQEKFDAKNWDRALSAAEQGLELDPDSASLNLLAGNCYERKAIAAISERNDEDKLRYYSKAVEHLERTLKADSQNLQAMDLLAGAYIKVGRETDAVRTWDKIINMAPDSLEATKAKNYKASRGFSNP